MYHLVLLSRGSNDYSSQVILLDFCRLKRCQWEVILSSFQVGFCTEVSPRCRGSRCQPVPWRRRNGYSMKQENDPTVDKQDMFIYVLDIAVLHISVYYVVSY